MNPQIVIKDYPINSENDNVEDLQNKIYYNVIVSDNSLVLHFIVCKNQEDESNKVFEIVSCEKLSLFRSDYYIGLINENPISSDATIVQEMFPILDKYGIKLNTLSIRNFKCFDSYIENKGFEFLDNNKYEKLKNLINNKCIYTFNK